jgi:hypothetical protein
MEIKSLQPAMAELERVLTWSAKTTGINGHRVVPTIQTRGKRARCGGWFAPDRWSTREGQLCHEINFSAELLKNSPEVIVALAIHEVVHLWCHSMGLKDVSKGGRHNKNFKEYAEILGLICADPTDTYGYGYTTAGEELAERIAKDCQPDVAMFNLFRLADPKPEPKPKTPSYKYSCGCTEFKTKAEVMATCNKDDCGNAFEVVG